MGGTESSTAAYGAAWSYSTASGPLYAEGQIVGNTTLHDTSGPPSKTKAKRKPSDGGLLSAAAQARSLVGVNDQRLPPWCIKEPHFTPESFTLLQASIKRITKTKSDSAVTTFTNFYDTFFNRMSEIEQPLNSVSFVMHHDMQRKSAFLVHLLKIVLRLCKEASDTAATQAAALASASGSSISASSASSLSSNASSLTSSVSLKAKLGSSQSKSSSQLLLNPLLLNAAGSGTLNASAKDREAVRKTLIELMEDKHDGLTPEHYARMGESLFHALSECDASFQEGDVRTTWVNAYSLLLHLIVPIAIKNLKKWASSGGSSDQHRSHQVLSQYAAASAGATAAAAAGGAAAAAAGGGQVDRERDRFASSGTRPPAKRSRFARRKSQPNLLSGGGHDFGLQGMDEPPNLQSRKRLRQVILFLHNHPHRKIDFSEIATRTNVPISRDTFLQSYLGRVSHIHVNASKACITYTPPKNKARRPSGQQAVMANVAHHLATSGMVTDANGVPQKPRARHGGKSDCCDDGFEWQQGGGTRPRRGLEEDSGFDSVRSSRVSGSASTPSTMSRTPSTVSQPRKSRAGSTHRPTKSLVALADIFGVNAAASSSSSFSAAADKENAAGPPSSSSSQQMGKGVLPATSVSEGNPRADSSGGLPPRGRSSQNASGVNTRSFRSRTGGGAGGASHRSLPRRDNRPMRRPRPRRFSHSRSMTVTSFANLNASNSASSYGGSATPTFLAEAIAAAAAASAAASPPKDDAGSSRVSPPLPASSLGDSHSRIRTRRRDSVTTSSSDSSSESKGEHAFADPDGVDTDESELGVDGADGKAKTEGECEQGDVPPLIMFEGGDVSDDGGNNFDAAPATPPTQALIATPSDKNATRFSQPRGYAAPPPHTRHMSADFHLMGLDGVGMRSQASSGAGRLTSPRRKISEHNGGVGADLGDPPAPRSHALSHYGGSGVAPAFDTHRGVPAHASPHHMRSFTAYADGNDLKAREFDDGYGPLSPRLTAKLTPRRFFRQQKTYRPAASLASEQQANTGTAAAAAESVSSAVPSPAVGVGVPMRPHADSGVGIGIDRSFDADLPPAGAHAPNPTPTPPIGQPFSLRRARTQALLLPSEYAELHATRRSPSPAMRAPQRIRKSRRSASTVDLPMIRATPSRSVHRTPLMASRSTESDLSMGRTPAAGVGLGQGPLLPTPSPLCEVPPPRRKSIGRRLSFGRLRKRSKKEKRPQSPGSSGHFSGGEDIDDLERPTYKTLRRSRSRRGMKLSFGGGSGGGGSGGGGSGGGGSSVPRPSPMKPKAHHQRSRSVVSLGSALNTSVTSVVSLHDALNSSMTHSSTPPACARSTSHDSPYLSARSLRPHRVVAPMSQGRPPAASVSASVSASGASPYFNPRRRSQYSEPSVSTGTTASGQSDCGKVSFMELLAREGADDSKPHIWNQRDILGQLPPPPSHDAPPRPRTHRSRVFSSPNIHARAGAAGALMASPHLAARNALARRSLLERNAGAPCHTFSPSQSLLERNGTGSPAHAASFSSTSTSSPSQAQAQPFPLLSRALLVASPQQRIVSPASSPAKVPFSPARRRPAPPPPRAVPSSASSSAASAASPVPRDFASSLVSPQAAPRESAQRNLAAASRFDSTTVARPPLPTLHSERRLSIEDEPTVEEASQSCVAAEIHVDDLPTPPLRQGLAPPKPPSPKRTFDTHPPRCADTTSGRSRGGRPRSKSFGRQGQGRYDTMPRIGAFGDALPGPVGAPGAGAFSDSAKVRLPWELPSTNSLLAQRIVRRRFDVSRSTTLTSFFEPERAPKGAVDNTMPNALKNIDFSLPPPPPAPLSLPLNLSTSSSSAPPPSPSVPSSPVNQESPSKEEVDLKGVLTGNTPFARLGSSSLTHTVGGKEIGGGEAAGGGRPAPSAAALDLPPRSRSLKLSPERRKPTSASSASGSRDRDRDPPVQPLVSPRFRAAAGARHTPHPLRSVASHASLASFSLGEEEGEDEDVPSSLTPFRGSRSSQIDASPSSAATNRHSRSVSSVTDTRRRPSTMTRVRPPPPPRSDGSNKQPQGVTRPSLSSASSDSLTTASSRAAFSPDLSRHSQRAPRLPRGTPHPRKSASRDLNGGASAAFSSTPAMPKPPPVVTTEQSTDASPTPEQRAQMIATRHAHSLRATPVRSVTMSRLRGPPRPSSKSSFHNLVQAQTAFPSALQKEGESLHDSPRATRRARSSSLPGSPQDLEVFRKAAKAAEKAAAKKRRKRTRVPFRNTLKRIITRKRSKSRARASAHEQNNDDGEESDASSSAAGNSRQSRAIASRSLSRSATMMSLSNALTRSPRRKPKERPQLSNIQWDASKDGVSSSAPVVVGMGDGGGKRRTAGAGTHSRHKSAGTWHRRRNSNSRSVSVSSQRQDLRQDSMSLSLSRGALSPSRSQRKAPEARNSPPFEAADTAPRPYSTQSLGRRSMLSRRKASSNYHGERSKRTDGDAPHRRKRLYSATLRSPLHMASKRPSNSNQENAAPRNADRRLASTDDGANENAADAPPVLDDSDFDSDEDGAAGSGTKTALSRLRSSLSKSSSFSVSKASSISSLSLSKNSSATSSSAASNGGGSGGRTHAGARKASYLSTI